MGIEENKAVVRRFMHELLAGGNLDVAEEVLAPDYVNVAMGGADRDDVKGMVAAAHAALKGQRFEDEELVAEGDAVFARFNHVLTLPDMEHDFGPHDCVLPHRQRQDRCE